MRSWRNISPRPLGGKIPNKINWNREREKKKKERHMLTTLYNAILAGICFTNLLTYHTVWGSNPPMKSTAQSNTNTMCHDNVYSTVQYIETSPN